MADIFYSAEHAGDIIYLKGECYVGLNPSAIDGGKYDYISGNGECLGIATGYYTYIGGFYWYSFQSANAKNNGVFWCGGVKDDFNFEFTKSPRVNISRQSTQEELNRLLIDHKYIMQNLEVCAMLADKLPNTAMNVKGLAVGYTPKQLIVYFYNRLRERESTLVNEDLIESKSQQYNNGCYEAGQNDLAYIIKNTPAVSAVPAVAIYIGVAVVAVVGAFVYYKLHNLRKEADYDLALSNEFLSWLKGQDEKTTRIVLNQLKATGDSAYRSALEKKGSGILDWFKNASNMVKWGLIGAGILFVYTQVDTAKLKKQLRTKFK